ncbi:MAG: 3-deoxy-7-phosphoheptulonate synthase AroG [Neisseriaceae bacterium]|nr:MAG: 3-deoxy-7-phosphoheptulonate synthase AroG [Neisseriaceae bacterium]
MRRVNVKNIDDTKIKQIKELLPPIVLLYELPINQEIYDTVHSTRTQISDIIHGRENRLLVITGPCSIHDIKSALDYAKRLVRLKEKYQDELLIVMRVYFEKPRTTVGWKGLINDPNLDETFDINAGLHIARDLLLQINELGIPAATEFLDMITPQYYADLISWGAIGARTTESQVHRQLASGLSCPVGFKNGTDGNLKNAIDAIGTAENPHHFLSVTKNGHSAIVETKGNPDCHLILRGGKEPNYYVKDVQSAVDQLKKLGYPHKVMVDFSHANSSKDYRKQMNVAQDVAQQINTGQNDIMGVMIESHLVEGRQDFVVGQELTYGQSITDSCIGWEETEEMLDLLSRASANRISRFS